MGTSDLLVEIFCQLSTEFLTSVCDQIQGNAISTNPFVKDGGGDRFCFFVVDGDQLDILREAVGDAQNELLTSPGGSEWSEQISVYPLVGFCGLRQ